MTKSKIYPIKPSDWINYIQGEISTKLNIMLGLIAAMFLIVVSIMQMSIITGDYSFIGINGRMPSMDYIAIEFFTFLIFIVFYLLILIRPSTILHKRIIKGELSSHEEILIEYNRMEFDIKKSWMNFKNFVYGNKKNIKSYKKVKTNKNIKNEKIWEGDPAFIKNKK